MAIDPMYFGLYTLIDAQITLLWIKYEDNSALTDELVEVLNIVFDIYYVYILKQKLYLYTLQNIY